MNIRMFFIALASVALVGCPKPDPRRETNPPDPGDQKNDAAPLEITFIERDGLSALWAFSKTTKVFIASKGVARPMSLAADTDCDTVRDGFLKGPSGCLGPSCRQVVFNSGTPFPALGMDLRAVITDLESGQGTIFQTPDGPVLSIVGTNVDAIEVLANYPIENLFAADLSRGGIILASDLPGAIIDQCFFRTLRNIVFRIGCTPITGCGAHIGPVPRDASTTLVAIARPSSNQFSCQDDCPDLNCQSMPPTGSQECVEKCCTEPPR